MESQSTRGRSVVSAVIQDRYDKDKIPQVWDELRRKIDDVQFRLPPSVRGKSLVVDDFGDVYGIFLAITGDGYTQPDLRRYAEFLRRVSLDLAGRIPSIQETRAFLQDTSADKRTKLIDRLLNSADYPRRMQEQFNIVLMERQIQAWSKNLTVKKTCLSPRSYLAVLRQNPGVDTGVGLTTEQAGYHLLLGYY